MRLPSGDQVGLESPPPVSDVYKGVIAPVLKSTTLKISAQLSNLV